MSNFVDLDFGYFYCSGSFLPMFLKLPPFGSYSQYVEAGQATYSKIDFIIVIGVHAVKVVWGGVSHCLNACSSEGGGGVERGQCQSINTGKFNFARIRYLKLYVYCKDPTRNALEKQFFNFALKNRYTYYKDSLEGTIPLSFKGEIPI